MTEKQVTSESETRTMTIAQCECPRQTSVPMCAPISLEKGSITVIGSAFGSPAAARVHGSPRMALMLAMVLGALFLWRPSR